MNASKLNKGNNAPLIIGPLLMLGVFALEVTTHILGTVSYVLIVLYMLWLSRYSKHVAILGMAATALMVIGFFIGLRELIVISSLAINRLLALLTIWLAVFFTIRYRRLYETEQRYKEQLKALFENASEGIMFINREGKIILANPSAAKMFGFKREELLDSVVEKLIPQRFHYQHILQRTEFFAHPRHRAMDSGRELFGLHKNGTEFPIDISLSYYHDNKEIFTIAFLIDISERKKQDKIIAENYRITKDLNQQLESRVIERTLALENALASVSQSNGSLQKEIAERKIIEERLRKSQQLYSTISRNFPEGIIAVLDRDLNYVFVEGKELSLIGLSEERRIGEHFFGGDGHVVLTPEQEHLLRKAFDGENVSLDLTIDDKNFDVLCTPLPDDAHGINEILVVIRNVTKFKTLESNLIKLLNRERELNAMKSRFVTIASHEFRTPLTTILSSTFLLENYSAQDFEIKRKIHFDRIKRSVNTLTELLNDFLSLGKLEEGKVRASYSEFSIKEELNDFIKEMESVKKKEQKLVLSYTGNGEMIMLDKKIFRNILSNLVSNAIKYSPADGEITVDADCGNSGNLKIRVIDSGIGIPEKEQRHIFKRFYRAQNAMNFEGTGLGLNIVRRYVRMLKGTIGFKSKPGKGTCFFVTIPVQSKDSPESDFTMKELTTVKSQAVDYASSGNHHSES